ncbi:hypothetical protein BDN67DRAFT_986507 [Paxillus ammoniavirescens]|nr:hypothetical protein BDN67DRAFT_986507 [Paxillus ammoniavirescens]
MPSRTPKPATPRPRTASEGDAYPGPQKPLEMTRPLNVTDALSYLDAVKVQFQDKPDVYNHFLDIMKDFKSEVIDTPGVIERVSMLFHGNPGLIQGFNTFLPPGYRIEVSADPRDPNTIKVTTPSGTTTQTTNIFEPLPRATREGGARSGLVAPAGGGSGLPFQMSRSITPYQMSHMQHPFDTLSAGLQGSSAAAAATLLGGLGGRNAVENKPAGEFNHAIQYLNKIKARYADDPDTYKQFLEILQTYQKEQRQIQDSQVYAQVQVLFKDAPDLLAEFKDFLPEASMAFSVQSGVVSILPQATAGPGIPAPWNDGSSEKDKNGKKAALPAAKRRRKGPEKDTTPAPPSRSTVSRAKKAKHAHKPGEPDSPHYAPYGLPPASPPNPGHLAPLPPNHVIPPQPLPHMGMMPGVQSVINPPHLPIQSPPDELLFFERAKRTLESRDMYEEFLKLLNLYSKDIIDAKTLVDLSQVFLGDGDLMAQFKDVLRLDERQTNAELGPPGSIRTGPPEPLPALPADEGEGPSYRKLPESEVHLACSGRDELCRSVLNDTWVSHPTWASEEAGFIAHKKNSFEEALHKSEEERHEYHVQLEALARTIALFEPLNARIEEMSNEERAAYRLKADFGGPSKSIYHRTLKRVYGRDPGAEVIQALQECPSVAVPVVLARLKAKDEEWRRIQREWNKTWREVDAKNFYKSLDHQGNQFKQNDKKQITAKHFAQNIEAIKEVQEQTRARQEGRPSFATGSLGHQLEFELRKTSVLQDSLRLVYSFLDHSQAQYSPQERRAIEGWLREFVPLLCMFPAAEFDAACGPSGGLQGDASDHDILNGPRSSSKSIGGAQSLLIAAGDLRRQLLKTAQEKSLGIDGRDGPLLTQSNPTSPCSPHSAADGNRGCTWEARVALPENSSDDLWIRTNQFSTSSGVDVSGRKPFFANTTIYTLLCLLQLIYSRLITCKEDSAKHISENLSPMHCNPIAVELGLDDPNGPGAVLRQAMEGLGRPNSTPDLVYMYFLDACEKLFDNELEVGLFEEHMRWFFGNQAYLLFTLDKLIAAFIKQVQSVLSDNKSQELWSLLQDARRVETLSHQDMIRYRREAEQHVGSDEHLYRMAWEPHSKMMYIQLLDKTDPSAEVDRSAIGRWREYVASYVLRQPTEWLPEQKEGGKAALFLRRSVSTDESPQGFAACNDMSIRISLGTYKLFYEAGTEDVLVQTRGAEEEKELQERVRRRNEERKRCRWLQG